MLRQHMPIPEADKIPYSDELLNNVRALMKKRATMKSVEWMYRHRHISDTDEFLDSVTNKEFRAVISAYSRLTRNYIRLYCDPAKKRTLKQVSALAGTSSGAGKALKTFEWSFMRYLERYRNPPPTDDLAAILDAKGSVRLRNALTRYGYQTVTTEWLVSLTRSDMRKMQNMGEKSIAEFDDLRVESGLPSFGTSDH